MKKAALSALAILCAWDILRPRDGSRRNPRRRLRVRAFTTRRTFDGQWRSFPSYREYQKYVETGGTAVLCRLRDSVSCVLDRQTGCSNMTETRAYACNGPMESRCSACILHAVLEMLPANNSLDSSGLTGARPERKAR